LEDEAEGCDADEQVKTRPDKEFELTHPVIIKTSPSDGKYYLFSP
jgi:hypothetical protein